MFEKIPMTPQWFKKQVREKIEQSTGFDIKDPFNPDLSWVNDYIDEQMTNSVPQRRVAGLRNKRTLKNDIFETHDYIIARFMIPEGTNYNKLKVLFNTNQLIIEGLPNKKEETFLLPANGELKGSEAIFKDNILEVKITKERNRSFAELNIKYL